MSLLFLLLFWHQNDLFGWKWKGWISHESRPELQAFLSNLFSAIRPFVVAFAIIGSNRSHQIQDINGNCTLHIINYHHISTKQVSYTYTMYIYIYISSFHCKWVLLHYIWVLCFMVQCTPFFASYGEMVKCSHSITPATVNTSMQQHKMVTACNSHIQAEAAHHFFTPAYRVPLYALDAPNLIAQMAFENLDIAPTLHQFFDHFIKHLLFLIQDALLFSQLLTCCCETLLESLKCSRFRVD